MGKKRVVIFENFFLLFGPLSILFFMPALGWVISTSSIWTRDLRNLIRHGCLQHSYLTSSMSSCRQKFLAHSVIITPLTPPFLNLHFTNKQSIPRENKFRILKCSHKQIVYLQYEYIRFHVQSSLMPICPYINFEKLVFSKVLWYFHIKQSLR